MARLISGGDFTDRVRELGPHGMSTFRSDFVKSSFHSSMNSGQNSRLMQGGGVGVGVGDGDGLEEGEGVGLDVGVAVGVGVGVGTSFMVNSSNAISQGTFEESWSGI